MKKAILFDFDYTLGDSTRGIVLSVNYGLERLGYREKSEEEIKKMIGLSLRDTFMTLMQSDNADEAERFAAFFREKADEVMVENTNLYDGVKDILKELKAEGYRIGIITTKYRYRIESIFETFDARPLLDIIVGGEDVAMEKPNPEGLLMAADKLKLDCGQILYVGDSLVDAKTAQNAGVDFFAVLTGTTKKEEFEKYPHVWIGDNIRDVESYLKEL